jgi:adapter protein MecA 1/2
MKIEKINENIIKITISFNDLLERNIDLTTMNYNSPAAQELFWDMMERAEEQFGFKASDSQLLIEASPDTNEGFIITITKLNEIGDMESMQRYIKNKLKTTEIKPRKKSRRPAAAKNIIYSFLSFDDLCALGKRMITEYSGISSVYKLKDSYYLVLSKNNLTASTVKSLENILNEYGKKVMNTYFYEGYINEYGTRIMENTALENLNRYF